jgi:ferredoxin-NADP reductase
MRARIKEKRAVAKETLLVTFDLLGREIDFEPGQYFFVTLPDVGHQDERGLRRHITVVTSPNERGVLGLCTRLRDTAFKRSLAELSLGAEVEVEEPKGDFVLPKEIDQPYVFIAEERLPHRVTLVYSNRDQDSAAFLNELSELERDNPNLRLVLTMTDDPAWEGETRRIDADLLRDYLDNDLGSFTYLVAGPPAMVEAMEKMLTDAGVHEERIRPERFSGY